VRDGISHSLDLTQSSPAGFKSRNNIWTFQKYKQFFFNFLLSLNYTEEKEDTINLISFTLNVKVKIRGTKGENERNNVRIIIIEMNDTRFTFTPSQFLHNDKST